MKFNASFLKNLNPKAKTGKFSLVKNKKTVTITSISLALAMVFGITMGISGCSNQKSETPTDTSAVVDEQPEEETKEDEFSLLADQLNVSGLTMTDDLTAKVQAEVEKQLEALTPEGETVFNPDDVYVAEDGSTWVSEDDYNNYNETGSNTTVAEGYLAPDGNVWASEADYLAYINGQGESTTVIEGDFYTAPDGTIWSSQEEYEKYVASSNGTVETPVENGEVVEQGEGYLAPDGTYWTSEAEYLDYVASQKNNTVVEEENENQTGTGTVEGSYYVAPDGSVWASEADYLDYIAGMNATTASTTTYVEEESTTTVTYDEEYYIAPDGTLWMSEADYLAFASSSSSELGTGTTEESTVTVVPESQYVEDETVVVNDTSNYYQDEDGNWWASYEDYLLYKQNEAELTR